MPHLCGTPVCWFTAAAVCSWWLVPAGEGGLTVTFLSLQHQIVQYLKDMFDFDNVRYTTVQLLAEDILQLSRRRSEILLGYLGTESAPEMNGVLPGEPEPLKDELI